MGLGERKSPSVIPTSERLFFWYVEGLSEARTKLEGFYAILR